jgi:hypothetical protein
VERLAARCALRSLFAASLFGAIAYFVTVAYDVALPVASAVYAGLLAGVFAWIGDAWKRRRSERSAFAVALLVWPVAFAALVFAHLQACYASGVIATASLGGGWLAIEAELHRLASYPPGDGALIGLLNADWESMPVGGLAVAFVPLTFARASADANKPWADRLQVRAHEWVSLHASALAVATFVVTLGIGRGNPLIFQFVWVSGTVIGVVSALGAGILVAAAFVADAIVDRPNPVATDPGVA